MEREQAQIIALKALAWLVGNEELCPIFLGSSGGSADDLRGRAGDPVFQASVLEFITMDDNWVMAFCDANDLKYDQPMRARYALPESENVHWT
ncbi:DUF3572 domain-containing protein [Yoonia sp. BS5-3]|uniref:DUF3572 domain-containing protein n=1 Tax=Yoonia phaeophyticola TaxID=3137369 RepID=A0ABZ2V7S5_9RHOB